MRVTLSQALYILCLPGLAMYGSVLRAEPPPAASKSASSDASSFSLKKEEALQKPVTIEAVDLPLGDLLKDLSRKSGVSLLTVPKVEDQRVSVHLTAQPLHQVMTRLCGLFFRRAPALESRSST